MISIASFFSSQIIHDFMWICSYLLKRDLMENFIFFLKRIRWLLFCTVFPLVLLEPPAYLFPSFLEKQMYDNVMTLQYWVTFE